MTTEGYVIMPHSVLAMVPEIGASGFAMFMCIMNWTDNNRHNVCPTMEKMAQEMGFSKGKISRAMKALEAAGLLKRWRAGHTMRYELIPPIVES